MSKLIIFIYFIDFNLFQIGDILSQTGGTLDILAGISTISLIELSIILCGLVYSLCSDIK